MNAETIFAVVSEDDMQIVTWAWLEDNARYAMRNLIRNSGGAYEIVKTHICEVGEVKHYNAALPDPQRGGAGT